MVKEDEPTLEQLKTLWKWCGFKQDGVGIWHCPNGIDERRNLPLDLNNLFNYAVPRLQKEGWQIDLVCFDDGTFGVACFKNTIIPNDIKLGKPELALFWAIWEVIQ